MAIQVNGTTVIDNSRNLTNIASVDSTSAAAITAAGVGGDVNFTVPIPNFASPDATFTSSGTWSKGSLGDSDLVWLYLVGGGNGGGHNNTGEGGGFVFVIGKAGTLNGSSYTIGAGGISGGFGTASSITVNGTTYTTNTNLNSVYFVVDGAIPTGVDTSYIDVTYAEATITNSGHTYTPYSGYNVSGPIFSGGSSPYVYYDGSAMDGGFGQDSLYAGRAGNSRYSHSGGSGLPTYYTGPTNGSVPGGGGGASYNGGSSNGGAGNMRQYNL